MVHGEDEDGEDVIHKFECSNEDTMTRAGVEENARLMVVMDQEDMSQTFDESYD